MTIAAPGHVLISVGQISIIVLCTKNALRALEPKCEAMRVRAEPIRNMVLQAAELKMDAVRADAAAQHAAFEKRNVWRNSNSYCRGPAPSIPKFRSLPEIPTVLEQLHSIPSLDAEIAQVHAVGAPFRVATGEALIDYQLASVLDSYQDGLHVKRISETIDRIDALIQDPQTRDAAHKYLCDVKRIAGVV